MLKKTGNYSTVKITDILYPDHISKLLHHILLKDRLKTPKATTKVYKMVI